MRVSMKAVLAFAFVAAVSPVRAADKTNGSDPTPSQGSIDRAAVSADIFARWAGSLADGGTELRAALKAASPDVLAAAAQADSRESLREALAGRPIDPNVLGDPDSDLVFFPLTPCRLVDTRLGGGILAGGTNRAFETQGNLSAQGGSATGCGVPGVDPAALAVTITAVNPQGAGNLRAYPSAGAVPNASVVNYALPGQGLNLANTTIVPLTQDPLQANEFAIQADVSSTHVVVDVVGHYFRPTLCAAGQILQHGICFETGTRAAASVFTASDTCHGAGGRLATGLELRSIRGVAGITLGDEWTDSAFSADGTTFFAMIVADDGGFTRSSTITPHVYRCVFSRFLPN
jgi:hypothetical protein